MICVCKDCGRVRIDRPIIPMSHEGRETYWAKPFKGASTHRVREVTCPDCGRKSN